MQTRKRRIYDVTNVLEGVGLIQKTGTNNVKWVPPDEASALSTRRFRQIHQQRLDKLDALKKQMEDTVAQLTGCMHQLTTQPEAQQMLYVTQRDIVNLESLQGCASVPCACMQTLRAIVCPRQRAGATEFNVQSQGAHHDLLRACLSAGSSCWQSKRQQIAC